MKINFQGSIALRLFIFFFMHQIIACNSPYTAKPQGYFRIPLPQKEYQHFNTASYPYQFDYPAYAVVSKDSTFFGDETENPWWVNINYPQFNASMHISYKELSKYDLQKLINDAYNLTNKHTVKANDIKDSLVLNQNGVTGVFFKVGGDVATKYQFFLTDSIRHFVRGALYFDSTPNADSLQPVSDFLAADMIRLIDSWQWK